MIAPELLVDMLKDHMGNVAKKPKSTWNTGMGKFDADEPFLIESITLPMFVVKFTMLPVLKMESTRKNMP